MRTPRLLLHLLLVLAAVAAARAQDHRPIAFTNARIVTVSGATIERGSHPCSGTSAAFTPKPVMSSANTAISIPSESSRSAGIPPSTKVVLPIWPWSRTTARKTSRPPPSV